MQQTRPPILRNVTRSIPWMGLVDRRNQPQGTENLKLPPFGRRRGKSSTKRI